MTVLNGWDFTDDEKRAALKGERLLNPSLDVGVTCDLNCPYCFTEDVIGSRRKRRPDELSEFQVLEVVDDFIAAGARSVNIVGAGEPLLSGLTLKVVERCAVSNVRTVIFTNGTRLAGDTALVDHLAQNLATIVLKMNSMDSALQDAVAGRKGYAARRDQALDKLIGAGFNKPSPSRLGVDTLAFAGNLHELPTIHRFCRERNIVPLTADFIPTGRTSGGSVATGPEEAPQVQMDKLALASLVPLSSVQRTELLAELESIDQELGISRSGPSAYYGGGKCTQLLGVYVDVEGRIWPCVARQRLPDGRQQPLGCVHEGDKPSKVWAVSRYMSWIRQTYTGACPYKESFQIVKLSARRNDAV